MEKSGGEVEEGGGKEEMRKETKEGVRIQRLGRFPLRTDGLSDTETSPGCYVDQVSLLTQKKF